MNRIAIVILNYEAYRETEKCVESILKKKLDVVGIVIVDNASRNNSFLYLTRKYQNNSKIRMIKSYENLGFARGNNLGIKVAREEWKADFILLLNSDTVILEEDYLAKVLGKYEQGIGVMQTSALRLNGRYTQKNNGTFDFLGLFLEMMQGFCAYYNIFFPCRISRAEKNKLDSWVSGCDILLTPDYFRFFEKLYPLTYLYGEEYILAIMLKKANLKWKIVEDAYILHAESKSTPPDLKEGTIKKKKMMLTADRNKMIVRIMPLIILRWIINSGKW